MTVRKKFGEILVEAGVVKEVALRQALERQKLTGRRIGQMLETMGIITEKDIAVALGRQYGYRTVKDFARYSFPQEVLALVTPEKARKSQVFPLKVEGNSLLLAMVNPLDVALIDEVETRTKLRVSPCVTTPKEIQSAIAAHYGAVESAPTAVTTAGSDWWSILVIDPDRANRTTTATFLKGLGYQVEEAGNGPEALGLALQLSPHLILVATDDPARVDARELFRSLRGTIPFIGVGSGAPDEEITLLEAGFVDYLPRPLHQGRLAARVRRGLLLVYNEPQTRQ